jgi:hypothetical protein
VQQRFVVVGLCKLLCCIDIVLCFTTTMCLTCTQAARRTSGDKRSPRTSGSGMVAVAVARAVPTTPRDTAAAGASNSSVRSPQTTSPPYQHITVSLYMTMYHSSLQCAFAFTFCLHAAVIAALSEASEVLTTVNAIKHSGEAHTAFTT